MLNSILGFAAIAICAAFSMYLAYAKWREVREHEKP